MAKLLRQAEALGGRMGPGALLGRDEEVKVGRRGALLRELELLGEELGLGSHGPGTQR